MACASMSRTPKLRVATTIPMIGNYTAPRPTYSVDTTAAQADPLESLPESSYTDAPHRSLPHISPLASRVLFPAKNSISTQEQF